MRALSSPSGNELYEPAVYVTVDAEDGKLVVLKIIINLLVPFYCPYYFYTHLSNLQNYFTSIFINCQKSKISNVMESGSTEEGADESRQLLNLVINKNQ